MSPEHSHDLRYRLYPNIWRCECGHWITDEQKFAAVDELIGEMKERNPIPELEG